MKIVIILIFSILLNPTEINKDSNIGMYQGNLYGATKDGEIKIHFKYVEWEKKSQFNIEVKNKKTSFKPTMLTIDNPFLFNRKRFDCLEFKTNNHYYKIIPNNGDFTEIECFTVKGLKQFDCQGYSFNGHIYYKKNKNDKETMLYMNFKIEQGI